MSISDSVTPVKKIRLGQNATIAAATSAVVWSAEPAAEQVDERDRCRAERNVEQLRGNDVLAEDDVERRDEQRVAGRPEGRRVAVEVDITQAVGERTGREVVAVRVVVEERAASA